MGHKIPVEIFVADMDFRLKLFKEFWKIQNQKDDREWPLEMAENEWLEHFLIVISAWDEVINGRKNKI